MILITRTFKKNLKKIGSVSLSQIQGEIGKHNLGLSNLISIGTIGNKKVLKGYLNAKKVRIVILFKANDGKYFPFYIVRKETKQGYNISSNSILFLERELQKHYHDLENGDFEKIELG